MSRGWLNKALAFLFAKTAQSNYCKLPNGTLICWGAVTFPATSTGLQKASNQFAHAFLSGTSVYVVASWRDSDSTPNYMDFVYVSNSTTTTDVVLAAKRLNTSWNWYASYIAIGRWK